MPYEGKKGSFVLQHFGTMSSEGERLILEVVPNTGAGELSSINGKMQIDVKDGKHYYDFSYELE